MQFVDRGHERVFEIMLTSPQEHAFYEIAFAFANFVEKAKGLTFLPAMIFAYVHFHNEFNSGKRGHSSFGNLSWPQVFEDIKVILYKHWVYRDKFRSEFNHNLIYKNLIDGGVIQEK